MIKTYLVTESAVDKAVFQYLLSDSITKSTKIVTAGGKSLASTILIMESLPVALVIDTDTFEKAAIKEQKELSHKLLFQISPPDVPFAVFTAIPQLEAVFLTDKALFEAKTQQQFSDSEWEFAKSQPKKFLLDVLGKRSLSIHQFLANLSEEEVNILRKHPLISELSEFLSKVINKKEDLLAAA